MQRPLVLCASLLCLATALVAQTQSATVSVTGGRVAGVVLPDASVAFRGIPYAAPPVGDLRWRAPRPVRPWTQLRAAQPAHACAQQNAGWNRGDFANASEDCLYLSVDTPTLKPARPLPVMIWIHGGANYAGASGASWPAQPEPLVAQGVVLVRIQYRLGLFGFLAHPELDRENGGHSGNWGLLDQVQALTWVRDNIAAFGGDPSNVTIFGQSAGAYDAYMLTVMPLARGLFHKAIYESAPSLDGMLRINDLAKEEQRTARLISPAKPPAQNQIAFLRALSTDEIIKLTPAYDTDGEGVIVDGRVLPEDPLDLFRSGKEARIPLIVGTTAAEEAFPEDGDKLADVIRATYSPAAQPILEAYGLTGSPMLAAPRVYGDRRHQFATDIFYRCHSRDTALTHSRFARTWQYEWARAIPGRESEGPVHTAELGHVFGTFFLGGAPTAYDNELSAKVIRYWTNFAKYGDPNDAHTPMWPAFDNTKKAHIEFGDEGPQIKYDLRPEPCRQLDAGDASHRAEQKK